MKTFVDMGADNSIFVCHKMIRLLLVVQLYLSKVVNKAKNNMRINIGNNNVRTPLSGQKLIDYKKQAIKEARQTKLILVICIETICYVVVKAFNLNSLFINKS